jgi:hypothetical protein
MGETDSGEASSGKKETDVDVSDALFSQYRHNIQN